MQDNLFTTPDDTTTPAINFSTQYPYSSKDLTHI